LKLSVLGKKLLVSFLLAPNMKVVDSVVGGDAGMGSTWMIIL
jgi:hypothetical protein